MWSFIPSGFTSPFWLILGFFLCGIGIVFLYRSPGKENFSNIVLIQKVYKSHSYWYIFYKVLILCITFLFFFILADPYTNTQIQKELKNGVDIEIVFDLSYSMLATDISPNRLEVAKQVLVSFLGELSQDRVGLVLFAGKPFQSVPLSYDFSFLQDFIKTITVETVNQNYEHLQGTAIGDALVMAAGVLTQQDTNREKVIVFITDGEANKGIDPKLALKLLQEKNIKTYTIGVGKENETTIILPGFGGLGQKVLVSGVDEVTLQKIASETGGKYFRADSQNTFEEILATIAKLEKHKLESEKIVFHTSLKERYIVLCILLLTLFLSLLYFKNIRLTGI